MNKQQDDQIRKVLELTDFYSTIIQKGGLNPIISAEDLSLGEKQMVCLCRALFKNSKIILIDETTANMDQKTDQKNLRVLKQKCKQRTVITIAHRLKTLYDCDRVIVMQQGQIIEEGSAQNVLKKKDNIFKWQKSY